MTRRTSIVAYHAVIDSGVVGRRQKEVYQVLYDRGPMTTNEIFRAIHGVTSINQPNIHARCRELCDLGLIEEVGTKICQFTKKRVIVWDVTDQLPVKSQKQKGSRIICVNAHADAGRLIAWIQSSDRKPANTAFTEGPDRQVAYAVEWIFTQLHDAREEIRRFKNGELF